MLLNHYLEQVDEYSFIIKDKTTLQAYVDAGMSDISTAVTAATLVFTNTMDDSEYVINILTNWKYIFECGGLTINIIDFPDLKVSGYKYFPDGLYKTKISYTYDGVTYNHEVYTGFKYLISRVISQQILQSDWKKELHCDCNCVKFSSSIRKFNWQIILGYASENCLYNEYKRILRALYKITGTTYEFEV